MDEYMTVKQAAQLFKVHDRTVRRWCWSARLPFVKIGGTVRIRREDLETLWKTARERGHHTVVTSDLDVVHRDPMYRFQPKGKGAGVKDGSVHHDHYLYGAPKR